MYDCTFENLLTQYGPKTPAGQLTLERTSWGVLGRFENAALANRFLPGVNPQTGKIMFFEPERMDFSLSRLLSWAPSPVDLAEATKVTEFWRGRRAEIKRVGALLPATNY